MAGLRNRLNETEEPPMWTGYYWGKRKDRGYNLPDMGLRKGIMNNEQEKEELADIKGGRMNGNNNEGKILEFANLEHQYTEMGERLYKLSLELGYTSEEDEELRNEFKAILDPAGFFVWGVDKIEHLRPPRDVYQIQVCRKLPIEIESGECTLIEV